MQPLGDLVLEGIYAATRRELRRMLSDSPEALAHLASGALDAEIEAAFLDACDLAGWTLAARTSLMNAAAKARALVAVEQARLPESVEELKATLLLRR